MKKIWILVLTLFNIFFILVTMYVIFFMYDQKHSSPIPKIVSVNLTDDEYIEVKFNTSKNNYRNNIYYLYKTDETQPTLNDDWKLTNDNKFSFKLDKNTYYVYLKNEDDFIFKVNNTETIGKVTKLTVNKEKIYLAIDGTYNLSAEYETIGNVNSKLEWYSDNNDIASVDENGLVIGKSNGTTTIHCKVYNEIRDISVVVTDLIINRPREYDRNKPYLSCGRYSKEENDLLDEILKARIEDVGYQTRAGAVEAARFLALEFPYKIRYFSENGRGNTNGIDGEGRYYHVGLYLNESRFEGLRKTSAGPKTWGCQLYSRPSQGKRPNGLDCSGFVSWAMLNGGFDVGDIGAGLAPHLDLTDYGVRTNFNASVVSSGKVKVGDLLSSGGVGGGHIAIIVGEDNDYYYVAESLWTPPNVAVVIIPYSKKTIYNRYYYVMLMDDYYKEDGKLTNMW